MQGMRDLKNRLITRVYNYTAMLKYLFYFGLGYITARWLILHYGTDVYLEKERALIGSVKEKGQEIEEEIFDNSQYQQDY